jgi:drug/metabolite transporter (DMT)-like permease
MLARLSDMNPNSSDILTLICAVFFAFQILFLGKFVGDADFRHLLLLQISGVAVFSTLMIPFVETPSIIWSPRLGWNFFVTAILSTVVTFYVQARAQQFTTPNRAALIFSLEPLFAALFAYWLLGDLLTIREWVGGSLILAGILVSEIRASAQDKSMATY